MRSVLSKILLIVAALIPINAMAADAVSAKGGSSFNPVLLGLVSIIVVLMAAIGILSVVLKQLAFALREKHIRAKSGGTIAKAVLLLMAASFATFTSFAQAAEKAAEVIAPQASPYIDGIPTGDFYFITGVICFEFILIMVLLFQISAMVRTLRDVPDRIPLVTRILSVNLLDYFNKSVAVKDEHTIVLDHDYDGIHELDNSLPPWWKWGFVFTIVFAVAYMWYYQVGDGPGQIAEYTAAVQKGEEEKAAYLAKAGNSVDENTVTLIADAGQLADAKTLFKNTCAACHREDAGGNVGPNLTDNFWLHGGKLQDVFKSIKYGWKDKGMPEWQHNMSAKQIAGIASYVMSLKGTNPSGAKPPQGEPYVQSSESATDTAKNKAQATNSQVTIEANSAAAAKRG